MPDFLTLTCPTCGGKLQITNDIERFACAHCGNEHIVKRGSGIVTLAPVVEGMRKIQTGVDKTASELAIQRLTQEMNEIKQNIRDIKDEVAWEETGFGHFIHRGKIANLKDQIEELSKHLNKKEHELQKHKDIVSKF